MTLRSHITITLLLTLLVFSNASAANYGVAPLSCSVGSVTIPCPRTGWDVAIGAIYADALNNDLWFATTTSVTSSNTIQTELFADHDHEWGYRLEGSYHFARGKDLTLNWLRYDDKRNDNISNLDGTLARGMNTTTPTIARSATSSTEFDVDELNGELGQHIDLGVISDLRLHAGWQYIHLQHKLGAVLSNINGIVGGVLAESHYRGYGIRVGADTTYWFYNTFGLTARVSGGLVVGNLKSRTTTSVVLTPGPPTNPLVTTLYPLVEERLLVPTGQANLALKYALNLNGAVVAFEAGWMWHEYLMSIRHRFSSVETTGVIGAGVMQSTSDLGLHGPYFQIKYYA